MNRPTDEQMKTIAKVIERLAPQFVFAYYDVDDIRQEAYIAALNGMAKYDPEQPLENFMAVHIRNRLINLKRDKFFRLEQPLDGELVAEWRNRNEVKRNIMCPVDIHAVGEEHLLDSAEFLADLAYAELVAAIRAALPGDIRNDFARMCDGVRLSRERREAVQAAVKGVMDGRD
jgi:DNA-directed RNA polymerase specialized sigma24 family protein